LIGRRGRWQIRRALQTSLLVRIDGSKGRFEHFCGQGSLKLRQECVDFACRLLRDSWSFQDAAKYAQELGQILVPWPKDMSRLCLEEVEQHLVDDTRFNRVDLSWQPVDPGINHLAQLRPKRTRAVEDDLG